MGLPTRVTSALRWLRLNALSWLTTSELEADRSSYSSLRHCRLRDKVSSFEALWLLFPEVAVTSAPEVMAQSIRTYSFSCAISFERGSTLSFISWFCCFSEAFTNISISSISIASFLIFPPAAEHTLQRNMKENSRRGLKTNTKGRPVYKEKLGNYNKCEFSNFFLFQWPKMIISVLVTWMIVDCNLAVSVVLSF